MKTVLLLLGCPLSLVSHISASTANFEDAKRLKDTHADCRLVQLQEWHNGHGYDLSQVTSAWVNRTRSNGFNQNFGSGGGKGTWNYSTVDSPNLTLQNDGSDPFRNSYGNNYRYANGTVIRKGFVPNSNFTGPDTPAIDLRNGVVNYNKGENTTTSQRQSLLQHIIRLTTSRQIMQQTLRKDQQKEQLLQHHLNKCSRDAERHRLIDTLSFLVTRNVKNKYQRLISRYTWEHQPFPFHSPLRTWSQYWHHIRTAWQPRWRMTESQEWSGFQRQIRTGQHSMEQSEFWRHNTRPWEHDTKQWLQMNCTHQGDYLRQRNILTGMGFFGFLVSRAADKGITGPTGSAFSLRQAPPKTCFGIPKETPTPRDLFVLTAERLVPKDLSSRVHAVVYGKTISHDGREYAFNATSGQFTLTADHNAPPQHSIVGRTQQLINRRRNLKIPPATRRLGRQIDRLICMYQHRRQSQLALDNYYRELRTWHKYGRSRGLKEPTLPPSPAAQCGSGSLYSTTKDDATMNSNTNASTATAEQKQEQIEQLHQQGKISDSEYAKLSEMTLQYQTGCNGDTHPDLAQEMFSRSSAVFNPDTGRYEESPTTRHAPWTFNPLINQFEKPTKVAQIWNPFTGQSEAQNKIRYDPRTGRPSYVRTPDFKYDNRSGLYRSTEGTFDEKAGIFTSLRGFYDWRTGKFDQHRGWHDYQTGLYRSNSGWYDPKSRLYHTRIAKPRSLPRRDQSVIKVPLRRPKLCCKRTLNRVEPPAVLIRPPSI